MSIGANLIEGSASNETKYWLCLLRDSNLANKVKVEGLLSEVTEIANMLAAGVLKLKRKNF